MAVELPMTKKVRKHGDGLQSRLKLGAELLIAFRRMRAENSCSCGIGARNNMKARTAGGDRNSQQKISYWRRTRMK